MLVSLVILVYRARRVLRDLKDSQDVKETEAEGGTPDCRESQVCLETQVMQDIRVPEVLQETERCLSVR